MKKAPPAPARKRQLAKQPQHSPKRTKTWKQNGQREPRPRNSGGTSTRSWRRWRANCWTLSTLLQVCAITRRQDLETSSQTKASSYKEGKLIKFTILALLFSYFYSSMFIYHTNITILLYSPTRAPIETWTRSSGPKTKPRGRGRLARGHTSRPAAQALAGVAAAQRAAWTNQKS